MKHVLLAIILAIPKKQASCAGDHDTGSVGPELRVEMVVTNQQRGGKIHRIEQLQDDQFSVL